MGKKKKDKIAALREINGLFSKAKEIIKQDERMAARYIKKAKRIAMRHNLRMPREIRKRFCRRCYSLFTLNNSKTRIKHGFIVIHCLKCGRIYRYKPRTS